MDEAVEAAQRALDAVVETCETHGFVRSWQDLVRDVYATNLSRYEPDELGDTAMTLGTQCSENLKVRAIRRFRHEEPELPEDFWDFPGLVVGSPRNSLTISFPGARIVVMKVPYAEGRVPGWERLADWEHDSQIRSDIAAANSRALRYRTHAPVDVPMFEHSAVPGVVTNFMLVWGGEADDGRTAGWLTVPAQGESPFIARRQLWWDEEPATHLSTTTTAPRGPSFDERPGVMPQVTVKPRPGAEGQS